MKEDYRYKRDGAPIGAPPWDGPDYCSHIENAKKLAGKLRLYWAERGRMVKTEIVRGTDGEAPIWCVRSDLVNGLPAKWGAA